MTRLSPVLTSDDLPAVELQAARLDGEMYGLDVCFCPIDELESRALRAEAIAVRWPERLIAEQRSAAWVLGATDNPPLRHELCADIAARAKPNNTRRARIREVVIDANEIVRIGRLDVTTPIRTVLDLVRSGRAFDRPESAMCARLMLLGGFGLEECLMALETPRNLPNRKVARERLASLC